MTNEELVARIQGGETELMLQLWDQVKPFIYWMARQRIILTSGLGGVEIADLVQAGYLALVDAVERFNPDGGSFISLLSLTLRTAFSDASGTRTRRQALDPINHAVSLDEPVNDDGDVYLVDTIQDDRNDYEDADQWIWLDQLHVALDAAMKALPADQDATIRRRYYDGETLREIAADDGVSIERVRQRERQGLKTMKAQKHRTGLAQFIEEHRRELDSLTPWYMNVGVNTFNRTHSSAVEKLVLLRDDEAQRAYRAERYRLRLEAERCQEGNPKLLDD